MFHNATPSSNRSEARHVPWLPALAMDALTHDGPADPSRLPASVCQEVLMPGVDPRTFVVNFADASFQIGVSLTTDPRVTAEPQLKSYTLAKP